MKDNKTASEQTLKYRNLTKNIPSSVIGFGGGSISGSTGGYGYGDISEEEAIKVLEYAYEKGITLFDTAPIYGFGSSEQRIGKALSRHSGIRKNLTIVSKLGVTWDDELKIRTDNSPDTIKRMLEKSLVDLQTDYIDVYLIHWPDPQTPIEETMKVLSDSKRSGVIKAIGASNFGIDLVNQASQVDRIEVLQSEWNAFNNTNAKQLEEFCRLQAIGFMAYGTLAKGILSGRVNPERKYDKSDFRGKVTFVQKQATKLARQQQEFLAIASKLEVDPAALATAYVLQADFVSTALVGAKNQTQIDSLLAAAHLDLPAEYVAKLDALCTESTPIYLSAYEEN